MQKQTHPKTLSSRNTFIQKHFHPKTLSSKREDTFVQNRFHPMTLFFFETKGIENSSQQKVKHTGARAHASPAYLNSASAPCGRLNSRSEEATALAEAHANMEPQRSRHACSTRRCMRNLFAGTSLSQERSGLNRPPTTNLAGQNHKSGTAARAHQLRVGAFLATSRCMTLSSKNGPGRSFLESLHVYTTSIGD